MECVYTATLTNGVSVYIYKIRSKQFYLCWVSKDEFGFKQYSSLAHIRKRLKKQFGIEVFFR